MLFSIQDVPDLTKSAVEWTNLFHKVNTEVLNSKLTKDNIIFKLLIIDLCNKNKLFQGNICFFKNNIDRILIYLTRYDSLISRVPNNNLIRSTKMDFHNHAVELLRLKIFVDTGLVNLQQKI